MKINWTFSKGNGFCRSGPRRNVYDIIVRCHSHVLIVLRAFILTLAYANRRGRRTGKSSNYGRLVTVRGSQFMELMEVIMCSTLPSNDSYSSDCGVVHPPAIVTLYLPLIGIRALSRAFLMLFLRGFTYSRILNEC